MHADRKAAHEAKVESPPPMRAPNKSPPILGLLAEGKGSGHSNSRVTEDPRGEELE